MARFIRFDHKACDGLLELRISRRANHAIAEIYDGVFRIPFSDFQRFALDQLRATIAFDSATWLNGVHETDRMHSCLLVNQPDDLIRRYLADYAELDLIRNSAVRNAGTAYRIEDTLPLEVYRASRAYAEFWKPAAIEHAMAIAVVDPISNLVELIVLWRADRNVPFSDVERAQLELFAPHLAAAWRHRHLVHLFEESSHHARSHQLRIRGHAICDNAGTVYASDSHFSAALASRFPDWLGPELPGEVRDMVRSAMPSQTIGGLDFVLTMGEQRSLLAVHAPPLQTPLTGAELRAATLFAAGKTNTQIADELGLSQSTVRNQLLVAYRKLNVHSKVELVKMLAPAD